MPIYSCDCCIYASRIKSQFNRHLSTKKHQRQYDNFIQLQKKIKQEEEKKRKFACFYCEKVLSSVQSKRRHESNVCKLNPTSRYHIKQKGYNDDTYHNSNSDFEVSNTSLKGTFLKSQSSRRKNKKNTAEQFSELFNEFFQTMEKEGIFKGMVSEEEVDISQNKTIRNTNTIIEDESICDSGADISCYTSQTRITINGEDMGDDPMSDPNIKFAVIRAFGHPFFQNNIHFVPIQFFKDDEFRQHFNLVHNFNIEIDDIPQLQRHFNIMYQLQQKKVGTIDQQDIVLNG